MPLFNFTEPFAELDLLDTIEKRFTQLTQAKSFLNPARIARTASLASIHPTIPQAFLKATLFMDIGNWPAVQDIATRAAVMQDRPNYDLKVANRQQNLTRKRLDANPDTFMEAVNPLYDNPITRTVYSGAKGVVRSAFTAFDSAFDEYANAPIRQAVQDYRNLTTAIDTDNPIEEGLASGLAGGIAGMRALTSFGIGPTAPLAPISRGTSDQQGRSQIALAVSNYIDDNPTNNRVNLGTGFLPGQDPRPEGMSDAEYQAKYGIPINEISHARREELQIGSRFGGSTSVSPGRLIFNNVVEPGTAPHSLLSGLADTAWNIGADPTAVVGGGIAHVRKASKAFRSGAGLIDEGLRPTIDGVVGKDWLNTKDGEFVATVLANRNKLTEIRDILPDVKNRHLLRRLQNAKDVTEVKNILTPELGITVDKIPHSGGLLHQMTGSPTVGQMGGYLPFVDSDMARIAGFTPTITRQFKSTKLGKYFERLPGRHLSANNLDQALADVDDWMKVTGFDDGLREKHLNIWSSLQDGNGTQLYAAAKELMDDSARKAISLLNEEQLTLTETRGAVPKRISSVDKQKSRAIISGVHQLFDSANHASIYFIDEIGNPVWFPGSKIEDVSGNVLPTAHSLNEHLGEAVTLPDPQKVNRVMSRLARYGKVDKVDPHLLTRVANGAMTSIWIPMALVSAAWPAKVLGEEQVRMWFSGFKSAVNDPMQALAALTLGKIDPAKRMKATDIMGNDLKKMAEDTPQGVSKTLDLYRSALSRGHNHYLGANRNIQGMVNTFKKTYQDDPNFFRDWGDVELANLANDPIAQKVAQDGIVRSKKWFWSGPGKKFREDLALAMPNQEDGRMLLDNEGFSNLFLESYNARIHMKTGGKVSVMPGKGYVVEQPGNHKLIELLRTGKYELDEQVYSLNPNDGNYNKDSLAAYLEHYRDSAPPVIKGVGESFINRTEESVWRKAIDGFFNVAMSKPTNFLSRSPVFDQAMWSKIEELTPHLDVASTEILRGVAQRNKKNINIDPTDPDVAGIPKLTLREVEEIAATHGAEEVKKLLYDNSSPLYWTTLAKAAFPFAEAWWEVTSTWFRLFAEEPHKLRRIQQGLTGMRNEGFISVDEETGDQYFNIPGAGMLEDSFGLNGPVSNNLTLAVDSFNPLQGAYFPGFGPAVQIPVSSLLPQKSDWQWVRDFVAPFGVERAEDIGDVLENFAPNAAQKFWEALAFDDNNPRQAGMTAEILNQLDLAGEVDMSTPDGQQAAFDKARGIARRYEFIRAVGSFLVPGTPRLRQRAKDKRGEWTVVESIANKYNKIKDEQSEDEADDYLLENYNLTAEALLGGGATFRVQKRPYTENAFMFFRDNPEIFEDFPNVGYYLFPDQPDDKFEYSAYEQAIAEGSTVVVSPEQKAINEDHQAAREERNEALTVLFEAGISPNTEIGRELMRTVDDYLAQEYPGYNKEPVGLPQRASQEQLMNELRDLSQVEGPVTESQIHGSITDFITNFDEVQAMVQETTGLQTMESASNPVAIIARQTLFDYGEMLSDEDSAFRQLWNDILKHAVLTTEDQLGEGEPFDVLQGSLLGRSTIFGEQPAVGFTDDTAELATLGG